MDKKQVIEGLKRYKIHFIIWTLYMFQETVVIVVLTGQFVNPLIYIVHYVVSIALFYLFGDYGLPWALRFKLKSIWRIPIVIVIQIGLYLIFHYFATAFLQLFEIGVTKEKVVLDSVFILRNLYRCILFMGFSTGYYYLKTYLKERKKTEELEKERLEKIIQQQKIEQELVTAQNAFLKAQINPHFLFNTLDFIYHKVNAHSEVAGEAIVKLAQMMRFAIDSDEMGDTIYLADEIEQVESLLYLYQIRKTNDLNIHFSYTEVVKQLRLIPLVILTLVENIFKHGDISKDDDVAFVNLKIEKDYLIIQTTNLINSNKIENSNHSGLSNIQKRLNYAYGNEASFQYQTVNQHFKVNIQIPVKLLKGPI